MFTDCLADQSRALTAGPRALGIRVTSVMGDHVLKANRTIVKRVPRIWRDNTYRQVAATSVDLPVGVTYWASAKLGIDVARDNREIIEGIDVLPEFNEVRELIAVAIQNASALQRKVFTTPHSHRSQKSSHYKTVYQKETALPKRRCPRHGKPKYVTEAYNVANQVNLQGRSLGFA